MPFFDFWNYPYCDVRDKKNAFSIEFYSVSLHFSVETPKKEIKHVNTEKHEFDHRDELILTASFGVSDYENFDARILETDVSMGNSCTSWRLSITTLMEEVKRVIMETDEFDLSVNALFGIIGLSGFLCKDPKLQLSHHLVCPCL